MKTLLIVGIIVLFIGSYFLFKYLKGKTTKKSLMAIGLILGVAAIVFYIMDGFKENLWGISLAVTLIAFIIYRYRTEN